MTGVINEQWKGLMGVSLLMLIGLQLFVNGEEEITMKLIILIAIAVLGLIIPVFWLIGTATGFTSFGLRGLAKTRKEQNVVFNPHLGLTMADGGEDQGKKEEER